MANICLTQTKLSIQVLVIVLLVMINLDIRQVMTLLFNYRYFDITKEKQETYRVVQVESVAAFLHGLDELGVVSGLVEAERDLHVRLLPQLDDLGASHQQAHYGVHHLKHSRTIN